jgi:hypothetical protein
MCFFAVAAHVIPLNVLFAEWRGGKWRKQARKIPTQQCFGSRGKNTNKEIFVMATTIIIGRGDSTKHDARYVGHHKKLKTIFCLVSLSNARTRIYRLVLELPVLEWSSYLLCTCSPPAAGRKQHYKDRRFSRRAKKAGAQQLALKINIRRNPAALWLAAGLFLRKF